MPALHYQLSSICVCLFVTSWSSVETSGQIEVVLGMDASFNWSWTVNWSIYKNNGNFLRYFILYSGLRNFRHGMFVFTACCEPSSTKVDTQHDKLCWQYLRRSPPPASRSGLVVSMPDSGVSEPRFESHCNQLCISWWSLRYTALGTGCAPLLQCLGRLSLLPFVGR